MAGSKVLDKDPRKLTWLLLERGAEPKSALELADLVGHERFRNDVEDWTERREKGTGVGCCVQ